HRNTLRAPERPVTNTGHLGPQPTANTWLTSPARSAQNKEEERTFTRKYTSRQPASPPARQPASPPARQPDSPPADVTARAARHPHEALVAASTLTQPRTNATGRRFLKYGWRGRRD